MKTKRDLKAASTMSKSFTFRRQWQFRSQHHML